jgi:SAM-dependent methyltransferase
MKKYSLLRYYKFPLYVLIGKICRKIFELLITFFTVPKLEDRFSHLPFAGHAMQKLFNDFEFNSVLDIGSGEGLHAKLLTDNGKKVTKIDLGDSIYFKKEDMHDTKFTNTIIADFNDFEFDCFYDVIWCSHVLEHQPNPNIFLKKIYKLLSESGVLAITVPPSRNTMSGGHLSNWNAGLLLYNLVLAGFDCADASILKYGYNISIIVRKKAAVFEALSYDSGDLRKIKNCLPKLNFYLSENDVFFNGNIFRVNW